MPAIPATVMPIPACAIDDPHTASGVPRNRDRLCAIGKRNSWERPRIWAPLPTINQAAPAKASAANK